MSSGSPFSTNRFEYEREHVYYVDPEMLRSVVGDEPKPIYLIGPRGSGKTTLLKSLEWRERVTNQSLRQQIGGDVFHTSKGKMLGVYLKLPAIQLQGLEQWVVDAPYDVQTKASIVGTYLDLVWLQNLSEALFTLIADGELTPSLDLERAVVASICGKYPSSLTSATGRISTIAQLSSAIGRLREKVERAAISRAEVHDVIRDLDCFGGGIGSLGSSIACLLLSLCVRDGTTEKEWHIRVCMDEGEALSEFQLLVLNTLVRLTEWPVFFTVAFVSSPREASRTLLPNLTLQAADREIVSLSNLLKDARFRRLAEGVAAARVQRHLGQTPDGFSLNQILGTYSINTLLQSILNESVSPQAKALLQDSTKLALSPFLRDQPIEDAPPIYQAYLVAQLRIDLPAPETANWQRRRQESAELRKRMVAAYLAICADLGVQPRYAGVDMLIGVSDGSIRDLLRFLDWIFKLSGRELDAFIQTPTSDTIQDKALKEASAAKLAGIRSSGVGAVSEIENLVNGLGVITATLQSMSASDGHLRSSERGILCLPIGPQIPAALHNVLEAGEAGYLQLVSVTADEVQFRMHTSLAPVFGFSYRGAYYPLPLQWEDIETIRRSNSTKDAQARGAAIGQRLAGASTLSLFDN